MPKRLSGSILPYKVRRVGHCSVNARLAFLNKGNVTVTGNWDIELKDQFMSNTYYGTVRYDF